MKKRFNLLKKFIFLLILVSFNSLYAETFRVSKVKVINLTNTTSEMTAKLGINESLAIYLPEDKTFIQGLEIKMVFRKRILGFCVFQSFVHWDHLDLL